MKIVTPIAVSAVGAGVTGAAAGLIALSTAQAHLPALMTRVMKPVPHLVDKRVLLCTGTVEPAMRGRVDDEAQAWRRAIEAEHESPVVLVDLRVPPRAGARARARAAALAEAVPADHRRDFAVEPVRRAGPGLRTRGSRPVARR